MKYKQIQPPASLQAHIRYCWTLNCDSTDNTSVLFRTMADGCPGLIFQQPERGTLFQNHKKLQGIVLYGQTTKYAHIHLRGAFSTLGIYSYPHALKSLFGLNAEVLTDSCVDLNLLTAQQGIQLSEQLADEPTIAGQLELLFSYLLCQAQKNHELTDAMMEYSLSQMIAARGNISLRELRCSLQLSERTFERRFKEYVGITPKLFLRICRFQASLTQMRNHSYDKLSDIAFENDYADQSHFIRSFKQFSGLSPNQYQKRTREIVENFSAML